MSETWYRTRSWGNSIAPVEVESRTDKTLVVEGRRRAITSQFEQNFPTWEEAHAHLLARATKNVDDARALLAHEEDELRKVQAIKRQEVAA